MLSIRKATEKDCSLINKLASQVWEPTYGHILSKEQLDYMFDWMYAPHNLLQQMKEQQVYFIGYKNDEPCGYISVEHQDKDLFHLQKIYVLPSFQGCHAGSFLLKEAMKYIKSIHPEPCTMELNVNRHNKALQFYEHMGLKKVREGDFPIGNGYYMNDYIMAIEF